MGQKNLEYPTDPRTRPYGGTLYRTRAARATPRPITHSKTMHLVLRSPVERSVWRLTTPKNRQAIREVIQRCTKKYRVRILSHAINYNHVHFHIQLRHCQEYLGFIRALTAGIAMAVTGWGRGNPKPKDAKRFWEGRPFTSVVATVAYFQRLQKYIQLNQLEGYGQSRESARAILKLCEAEPWRFTENTS